MKTKLNSNLFRIVSVAMYGTQLDPDSMFDSYMIESDKDDGYIHFGIDYFWDNFQSQKYKDHIKELAHSFINGKHKVGDIEIEIEAGEIYSPKFYNFSNDEIDLTITFDTEAILNEVNKDTQTFNQFLKDRYSSYDGFNSFTSNNYTDWLEDFENKDDTAYGAVLTYIFKDMIEENQEEFIQYVCSDNYIDYRDFVDFEEHDSEVKVLHQYVLDNYRTIDIDSIDCESFEFKSLEEADIKKILKEAVLKIDNMSYSLF